jgi:signal transduction histidine kinase
MLQRRLARRGFEVEAAEGGTHALTMVEKVAYDLVLLDIMMPEVSGIDVLREIRKTRGVGDLPIIMATARTESDQIVEALNLGANDYVTKPLDFPVVLARVETQLEILRLRREQSRLLKLKDEFLAIASHDLKNPLSAVSGFAVLIQEIIPVGKPMTDAGHDFARRIFESAGLMESIISDFLDFQALEDGQIALKRGRISLAKVFSDCIDGQRAYAEKKGVELTFEQDQSLSELLADPARIAQVAQNLVGNAIKFCPEGARVTVRISPDDEWQLCEVVDSGPGLKEEDFAKVFQRYGRLSNRPTGGEKSSGLGLAICKQLIEMHGGEIGVRNNTPEKGATFWIRLPASTP